MVTIHPYPGSHEHGHHHLVGGGHPPSSAGLSLLRMSAWQRLGIAAASIGLLWLATIWAMG